MLKINNQIHTAVQQNDSPIIERSSQEKLTTSKIEMDSFEISRTGVEKSQQYTADGKIQLFSMDIDFVNDVRAHIVKLPGVTLLSDTRAEICKNIREKNGSYDYSDVVNATGYAYAKCYADIEKKYEEQLDLYYNPDGAPRTKEQDIAWLDKLYDDLVEWDTACAKVAAKAEQYKKNNNAMSQKDIEEYRDSYYEAREKHMNQYRNEKQGLFEKMEYC